MTNNLNPDTVIAAVYAALNADATLKGAGYLNNATGIWSTHAPAGASGHHIVIECTPIFPDGFSQFRTEIRIHGYSAALSNGQVDSAANRILYRCQELLNDEKLTISGMTAQYGYEVSVIPAFWDESIQKYHGVVRVRVELGYN
jgi:hypothetical protein